MIHWIIFSYAWQLKIKTVVYKMWTTVFLTAIFAQNVLFKFMPKSQFKDIGFCKKDFITHTNSMADMDFTKGLDRVKCPVLP